MPTQFTGFRILSRADLKVKDRTTVPPDRVLLSYHIREEDGTEVVVNGSWGDYLRDKDAGIVVEKQAPFTAEENVENAMTISDVYGEKIVPDKTFIPDPTLPL